MVTKEEKSRFLVGLLKDLDQEDEVTWLLQYLLKSEGILEELIFVEKAAETPRGLILNFKEETPQLFLYKNQKKFQFIPQIFHEIRLHFKDPLYLEVKGWDSSLKSLYLNVLTDNPFAPWNQQISKNLEKEISFCFKKEERKIYLTFLETQIEKALENHDEESFRRLAMQYRTLKKES